MSLNIKNQRACDVVREAAELSGLTQTAVVVTAVEEFIHRLTREQRAAQVEDTLREMHGLVASSTGPADPDFLYDPATGLPR